MSFEVFSGDSRFRGNDCHVKNDCHTKNDCHIKRDCHNEFSNRVSIKQKKILYAFPLFFSWTALAEQLAEQPPSGVNFLEAVLSASLIVQITFLILIVMSVVSWAIIFQKYSFFKQAQSANSHLEDVFLQDGSFEEIYTKARSHDNSSLSQIFTSGYNEMQKILKTNAQNNSSVTSLKGLDNVERALRKASEAELSLLESGLGVLATVGSSGPFIGLFGTVFGIMNSFNKIAVMGSASLNVVAPGIAEALLATGIGLFAAIPASIFYNSYLSQIRKFDLIFNNFTADFLNIAKRNFFQDKE
ncbi:MAG: protein TolQ [Oligoflexia bacterium]|nr:protein TolQ [Oligoflexia bacterium]